MQSFEKASQRLEEILELLSSDEISLEKSLELYAQAAELIQFCNSFLNSAQIKIRKIDEQLNKEVDDD